MFGWEALLLVRKVEQEVLEGVMSPALAYGSCCCSVDQTQQCHAKFIEPCTTGYLGVVRQTHC